MLRTILLAEGLVLLFRVVCTGLDEGIVFREIFWFMLREFDFEWCSMPMLLLFVF